MIDSPGSHLRKTLWQVRLCLAIFALERIRVEKCAHPPARTICIEFRLCVVLEEAVVVLAAQVGFGASTADVGFVVERQPNSPRTSFQYAPKVQDNKRFRQEGDRARRNKSSSSTMMMMMRRRRPPTGLRTDGSFPQRPPFFGTPISKEKNA
jgi:hypothetical protein